jgi:hypothetical protein
MNPKSHLSPNTAPRRNLLISEHPPEPLKPSDYVEIRELSLKSKYLSLKQMEQMKSYKETSTK